jgi:GNAT superfamily N-acetyltransferase
MNYPDIERKYIKMLSNKFYIKPIYKQDIEHIPDKCWENRKTQLNLTEYQEILGFGAWDNDNICVGQLHCYKITIPDWDDINFPGYARNRLEDWPLGWPLLAAKQKNLKFEGPVWGHACFHVGVLPGKYEADPGYFGQGIGKALLFESVKWAYDHKYTAVIAHGGPKAIPEYNVMMGCLPWTSYAAMNFEVMAYEEDGKRLPWWTDIKGSIIKDRVNEIINNVHELKDICARLMILSIK